MAQRTEATEALAVRLAAPRLAHRHLWKRAENSQLARVLAQMREQVRPVWTMSIVAPRRVRDAIFRRVDEAFVLRRSGNRRTPRPR
jgi:hypothetical protein